jgi:hypothetical protein
MINDGHDISLNHIRRSQPQPGSLHPACCACCREDIKAILKWIDAVTDELHDAGEMRKQTKRILWNLRTELDNDIKSRSTHNVPSELPRTAGGLAATEGSAE